MGEVVSVGAIEFSSIGVGYQAQDALMKAASTTLHVARPVSPGNYLVVFSGSVGDINMAMETARQVAGSYVVDYLTVANIHPALFPAMAEAVALDPDRLGALGIVETQTAVSAMVAADAACKAAEVVLFKLAFDVALNGKGLLLMNGDLSSVQAAVDAAAASIEGKGLLLNTTVIPRPARELFLGPDGDASRTTDSDATTDSVENDEPGEEVAPIEKAEAVEKVAPVEKAETKKTAPARTASRKRASGKK